MRAKIGLPLFTAERGVVGPLREVKFVGGNFLQTWNFGGRWLTDRKAGARCKSIGRVWNRSFWIFMVSVGMGDVKNMLRWYELRSFFVKYDNRLKSIT